MRPAKNVVVRPSGSLTAPGCYRWNGDPTDTCLMAVYVEELGVDDAERKWENTFQSAMPTDLRIAVGRLDRCCATQADLDVVERYASRLGLRFVVKKNPKPERWG